MSVEENQAKAYKSQPIFVGFRAKRNLAVRDTGLPERVKEICSLSECLNEEPRTETLSVTGNLCPEWYETRFVRSEEAIREVVRADISESEPGKP